MRILDSDYIELESRRRAQLAALQWQTVTRISKEEERRQHVSFITKQFLMSSLLFLIAATEWWFLTELKEIKKFFIVYNYAVLGVVYIQFLMLFLLQYILRYRRERSKAVKICYIFLLTQAVSMTLTRPIIDADCFSFIYACLITLGITCISFAVATIGHVEFTRSSTHLALWCQKYYLTTSTTIIVTMEFSYVTMQISISLILVFFLSTFIIIWGHSLGSVKFYRQEAKYFCYYVVLHYLSMISLMTNAIIFIQRFSDVDSVALR